MGVFSFLLKTLRVGTKYGFWSGSIYTFLGYFYAQEIKYRLGDDQFCEQVDRQAFQKSFDPEFFPLKTAMAINSIYHFYMRTWYFREFERDCKEFHRQVISSILKNYEEYGVFGEGAEMEAQLAKGEVNPSLLGRVLQVKELNLQLLSLYGEKYFSIVKNQMNLGTGAILGLTGEEKAKIELISAFIEKGEHLIFTKEDKYWEYKLMQSEARKHNYGDTIFKIIFI